MRAAMSRNDNTDRCYLSPDMYAQTSAGDILKITCQRVSIDSAMPQLEKITVK